MTILLGDAQVEQTRNVVRDVISEPAQFVIGKVAYEIAVLDMLCRATFGFVAAEFLPFRAENVREALAGALLHRPQDPSVLVLDVS